MLFVRDGSLILFNKIYGKVRLCDITKIEPTRFLGEELIQIIGAGKTLRVAVSDIEPGEEAALSKIERLIASATES